MNIPEAINDYICSQVEQKRNDMLALHTLMLRILPGGRLWFDDGKDGDNKTINNPTIGYGCYTIRYANGTSREFFQLGMSANATGISVFIMGIKDKSYLPETYGQTIGKAKVTGYCIRFKKLSDIKPDALEAAMRYGIEDSLRD